MDDADDARGEYEVNVIPSLARAEVDVRCPPGYELSMLAELEKLSGPDVALQFSAFEPPVEAPSHGVGSPRR